MSDQAEPAAEGSEPRLRLRSDAVDWLELEGEIVALDRTRSTYVAANSSGARLWSRLSEGATRQELVDHLVAIYGIEPADAARDVDSFVGELRERGLLED